MNDPAFFGYGSLVNLATHDYANPRPARLNGWRRVWRTTTLRDIAFLSVEQVEGMAIDGIIAQVPNADWAALDLREEAYDRHDISPQFEQESTVAVYQVNTRNIATDEPRPILLSYLDVVVQGFLQIYGEAGAAAFFESTTGWDVGVKDDRANPLYPRAKVLSAAETNFVDKHLATAMKIAG